MPEDPLSSSPGEWHRPYRHGYHWPWALPTLRHGAPCRHGHRARPYRNPPVLRKCHDPHLRGTGLGILATLLSFVRLVSTVGYDADVAIRNGSDAHHAHKLYLCSAATIGFIMRWAATWQSSLSREEA